MSTNNFDFSVLENSIDPELKPNYTGIPNIIMDYLMPQLSGSEEKIVRAICRQTYGWRKASDFISNSQMSKMTGLTEKTLYSSINKLIEKCIIIKKSGTGRTISKYALVYEPKKWKINWDNTEDSNFYIPSETLVNSSLPGVVKITNPGSESSTYPGLVKSPYTKEILKKVSKKNNKESGYDSFVNNTLAKGKNDIDKLRVTFEIARNVQKVWYNAIKSGVAQSIVLANKEIELFRNADPYFDAFHLMIDTIRKEDIKKFRIMPNTMVEWNGSVKKCVEKIVEAQWTKSNITDFVKWRLSLKLKKNIFTWNIFLADTFVQEFDEKRARTNEDNITPEEQLAKFRADRDMMNSRS